jgi:hypothetical protein
MKKAWKAVWNILEIMSVLAILTGAYISIRQPANARIILPVINVLGILLILGRLKKQLDNLYEKDHQGKDKP